MLAGGGIYALSPLRVDRVKRRNGKCKGALRVPGEGLQTYSGLGRPQLHRAIIAAACQVPAVGTEGDSSDVAVGTEGDSSDVDVAAAISRMSVTHATASYTLYPVSADKA